MMLEPANLWSGLIFDGTWRESSGGSAAVTSPATGERLGVVGIGDQSDVRDAARRGTRAQTVWSRIPFAERAQVLLRASRLWEENRAEFETWLVRESGSVRGKARNEVDTAIGECFESAAMISRPIGQVLPGRDAGILGFTRNLPAGVVGVISPFNAPLILAIRSVAPALALGNAVILKPDPRTAVCGGIAIARVFEEAGLPPGTLHVVPGGREVGESLVSDPDVQVISYTGSTAAGRAVAESAARQLKRVHLELGGNSALIVLDDADLVRAVAAGAWASFSHQGQICMATGRHIVHESIAADYIAALAAKADSLTVGDPSASDVSMGPLIDETQLDRVSALVRESVSGGATVAAGGTYEQLFYRPTVLADVNPATAAYAHEVFGPVAPVITFSDVDEAVRLARASEYGLSLGILTRNPMKALDMAASIPSGIVHINDQTIADDPIAPFGGVRSSGNGSRFGGHEANIAAFTETQWVTIRDDIPDYPL